MSGHRKWADVKAETMRKHMSDTLGNLPFLLAMFDAAAEAREPTYDVANSIIGEVRRLVAQEKQYELDAVSARNRERLAALPDGDSLVEAYDTAKAADEANEARKAAAVAKWEAAQRPPESREAYEDASEEAAAREVFYREDC